jgi:hypothetical protein
MNLSTMRYLLGFVLLINFSSIKAQDGPSGPFKKVRAKLHHNAVTHGQKTGAGQSSYLFHLGTSTYFGDLCDKGECMIFRPNFGIGYMYRLDGNFSFKSELNYYHLYSKDFYSSRNFAFRSDNFELYAGVKYDFIPYDPHHSKRKLLNPFAFIGLGLTRFNPKAELNGTWYALEPLRTEGHNYSRITPIIPLGLGVKVTCTQAIDVIVEGGFRKTFTDYMDDVSANEYKPISSFDDPVAASLSNRTAQGDSYQGYRGNPHRKDGYFIFQIKLMYSPRHKHIKY